MNDFLSLQHLLECPQCHKGKPLIAESSSHLFCECCGSRYDISHGRPVLLQPNNKIFCPEDYRTASKPISEKPTNSWLRFLQSPSVNLSRNQVLSKLSQSLKKTPSATVLIVGGGRQRMWLDKLLNADDSVTTVYCDVDINADIDFFCDAHDLPFVDGVFDAVVVTAVMELVIYPERVAAEIHRVLKVDGYLYSEMPFMQQVHEGAYDFTRYTLSGHRRLFNGFTETEAGMVSGPGTALGWAIENFALAFMVHPVRRKIIKAIVRLSFFWLKHFDRLLVYRPGAMDGASCTYFYGQKINGKVDDSDIIARYKGAKHLKHT
jgi:SAM-dependent methyltransferase/uncharacterized protein YbaR (Trm112 family)